MELLDTKVLIIAEAGVNHNGRLDLALKLCDEAKKAGADVVKFQTWKTELLITKNVEQAEYQKDNTGVEESQFDMLKKLELSYDDFRKIKKHCDDIGIIFASTADEFESLDFLVDLGIPFIKIGSGEVGNIPYLRYIGKKRKPVILSTGMSTMDEVELSYNTLLESGASKVILLHCTTNYPCALDNVNLKAMISLKEKFGCEVGYSDHTEGVIVAISAVALGAKVIEKHFTLDKEMEGPDHKASLTPLELKEFVEAIRNTEKIMGNGDKIPTKEEKEILSVVKKRIVASKKIKKGELITENMITVKRNDKGAYAKYWNSIVGSIAEKDYDIDEGIEKR